MLRTAVHRRILTLGQHLFICLLAWSILETLFIHHRLTRANDALPSQATLYKPARVYIASLHWNNERILRGAWNQAVVDLAQTLGPSNVFVSIHESGSKDGSKAALRHLGRALGHLGVARRISLDKTTHADEIANPPDEVGDGWIKTARGRVELRRIPYLSRLRNLSLRPLVEMAQNGTTFDYVLFLNDVVFSVSDVLALLNTNNGSYAAACSLDFKRPPKFYDTFALRDADGHEHVSKAWPYLRSSKSRAAMKRSEPVPVTSCWNGMVFMPAAAFTGDNAISFRGVDDTLAASHLEASECCLIHADNPASPDQGVYLNPNVRVGYSRQAYDAVHSGNGSWLSHKEIWIGLWRNRLARWFTTPLFKEWMIKRMVQKWKNQEPGRREAGPFCVINEMQVLVERGWAHV
ncbi:hypothetical protein ACJZ2D_007230 [Fusarium nematophilum]